MWDNLPPEIQEIILREKYILEAEEMKPIFKGVLEELLEYSFAASLKRSNKYVEMFFGEVESIFSFVIPLTCHWCGKSLSAIIWSKTTNIQDYCAIHIHGYKSLDGKYVCCYKIRESVDATLRGERPPISLSHYNIDSLLELEDIRIEDIAPLLDIPSKYEKERKRPTIIPN